MADRPQAEQDSAPPQHPTFRIRLSDQREFGPAEMALIVRWAQEGRIPADALLVPVDGSPSRSVLSEPALGSIVQAPPTRTTGIPEPSPADAGGLSGLIPYGNPPALVAYYLGVFSLIPLLGLFLAIPAFVFGIIGLRRRARDPRCKGLVHALVGVILGGICTILWGGGIVLMFASAAAMGF